MGDVLPFPRKRKTVPLHRLSKQQCDTVLTTLMNRGIATYLSIHNGGQYICVFNSAGAAYSIGREGAVFYLFDPDETVLAERGSVEDLLGVLEGTLDPWSDAPV